MSIHLLERSWFRPDEDGSGELVIEASLTGLRPGEVPISVMLDGTLFRRVETVTQDGEVIGWEYGSEAGQRVTILND